MAYPPSVPTGPRINTTPQVNTHPADHLAIHAALTDIVNELGANPSGSAANLTAWLDILHPVGEIKLWAGAAPPTNHALCDGAAVSRVTYPELFARIGTTYGVGDGSTTFNLPNLANRFVAGKGTTWADALAKTGGSKDAIVPNHTHVWSTVIEVIRRIASYGGGSRFVVPVDSTSDGVIDGIAGAPGGGMIVENGGVLSSATGAATTGEAVTDKNLPPYIALNYIIRLA
jgi:microcystin-dependent protein